MKSLLPILLCLFTISAISQDCTTYLSPNPDDKTVTASRKPMFLQANAAANLQLFWVKNTKGSMLGVEVLNGGLCVNDSTTVTFIMADGSNVTITHHGAANCDAKVSLFFGGKSGNDAALKALAENDVAQIRVKMLSTRHDAVISAAQAEFIKGTFACLLKK